MKAKTKTGLAILEAALLLGLLGDALLRATPWGLNVLLWIGALVTTMTALTLRSRRELWKKETIALHVALLAFAGFMAWRDSITLHVLNVSIILAILTMLSLPALNIELRAASFLHYLLGAISSALNAAFAPFLLVFNDIEWKTIPRRGWTKHLISVLRGLAVAAPLMLIFGALFMAADAVFENIVNDTFQIEPETVFGHVLLFSFLAWICGGYLRGVLFGSLLSNNWIKTDIQSDLSLNASDPLKSVVHETNDANPQSENRISPATTDNSNFSFVPEFLRFGAIEVGVVMGLINLLFLSFVAVQMRYFFGGIEVVQNTENFKLAEYARRGFFELCWVSFLVLPLLLTIHFLLRKDNLFAKQLFRVLAGIKIALLFVIMFSAVQRMLLYTGTLGYGMTTMRLYPTAFMFWLALVLVWFGLTVLRGQPQRFAWGAFWMALFTVAGLHVLNPDNFVVRHNLKLMRQGRNFDVYYMRNLSDDAVPALLEAAPEMTFDQQCVIKGKFQSDLKQENNGDFRSWNFSRWQAKHALLQSENGFQSINCPKPYFPHGEF